MSTRHSSKQRGWYAIALACVLGVFATSALADPPDRVARVSFLRGNVSFQAAGDDQWAQAALNRPLGTGDKVYTDNDSRVELEIGTADIRLDHNSTFDLLNLDDTKAQIELTGGVMNLHVRRIDSGESFEVDTPTLAFVVNQPGDYRVDIAPQGNSTMITVFNGSGDVYGENNASYSVRSGNSYRFNDSALHDYEVLDVPRADDFDQWSSSRDTRYERSVSRQYVSEGTIGYADLDDNGSWSDVPEYGNVWYPTTVEADWAPYRSGHWAWIDPWGWSWVDSAAWGFAPFHYGRWAYIDNRWGWSPGRRSSGFAIYAPALVGFIGGGGWGASVSIGGGGPVGWFPLGPRDVYVPWYQTSRAYFTNINVRNTTFINNTNITNVYNNYSNGRPINNANYAYRTNVAAVTAVSRDAFVGARPVNAARVQIDPNNLRNAQVVSRVGITPTQASFGANSARTRAVPAAAALDRKVIARTAPPPRPVPIAARLQAIQSNGSQPLQTSQLRQIATRPAVATEARALPARVQVVGRANAPKPQPLPMRASSPAQRAGINAPANPAAPRAMPAAPANAGRAPVARPNADTMQRAPDARTQPPVAPNRGGLPSSRFAPHPGGPAVGTQDNRANMPVRGNPATQPQRTAPVSRDLCRGSACASAQQTQPQRTAPVSRDTGRGNPAPVRSNPTAQPQRTAPVSRDTGRGNPAPARSNPTAQPQRSAPVNRDNGRGNEAPARNNPAAQPQRSGPIGGNSANYNPAQRSAPRSAPAPQYQRSEPVQQQQRQAPQMQQRAVPQRQVEPQRVMPQPQQRAQPAKPPAPPARVDKTDKDKKDNGGR
jgi:hypothetical protein